MKIKNVNPGTIFSVVGLVLSVVGTIASGKASDYKLKECAEKAVADALNKN